jgi:ribosomal protein S18 acetylase RimI-like enzyme
MVGSGPSHPLPQTAAGVSLAPTVRRPGEMTPVPLRDLPSDQVSPLLIASEAEGFRFLRRVVSEWESGANRFTGKGEALLGCFVDHRLVAICGLMRDPYQGEAAVGRLRNLYVLPEYRGRAIGATLARRVIELAGSSFKLLRLRASTPQAAALYERLGFTATRAVENCTHVMDLDS